MITPEEIKKKAASIYKRGIDAWLAGDETFFPYLLRVDLKLPASHAQLINEVELLRSQSKQVKGYGYAVHWEERKHRLHQRNVYPKRIYFDSLDDIARLLGKHSELQKFQRTIGDLRQRLPSLESWIKRSGVTLYDCCDDVQELILLTEYRLAHPNPRCFLREIPLPISTKRLESHKALLSEWWTNLVPDVNHGVNPKRFELRYGFREREDLVTIRILDETLQADLQLPFDVLAVPITALNALKPLRFNALLVENLTSLYALPSLSRTMAVEGRGMAVVSLQEVSWLHRRDLNLWYWGDMDVDGFRILDQCRKVFPHVRSCMMDWNAFREHQHLATRVQRAQTELLNDLTEQEQELFRHLDSEKLRIEQEHLHGSYVQRKLYEMTSRPCDG